MIHHFKTAGKHIRRSPYQAVAAVLIMTLTFFLTAVFFLRALGLQIILDDFEKQPQLTVFFSDVKTEEEIRMLDDRLKQTGTISETKYISKEDALKIYQEQNKDDPLLLEMVTADILPASLEIQPVKPEYLKDIAQMLSSEPGVEDIIYQKEVVDNLLSWIAGTRLIETVMIVTLGVISLLVLLTVIGMKIALKQKEIQILRLLGATSSYIRWPFLIEGGIYGIVASLFAWGLASLSVLYAEPYVVSYYAGGPELTITPVFMLIMLGVMLGGGLILGMLGSLLALIRYT